jgi:hypothetical protein
MKNKLIVKTKCRIDEWTLNSECRALAEPIAKKLKLSVIEFLTRLSSGLYIRPDRFEISERHQPPSGFTISLPQNQPLSRSIRNAARENDQTVREFVWCALISDLESIEESLILDSEGRTVGDALPLEAFPTFKLLQ